MVGYQNADSGMALTVGANKLMLFGRKRARGGEIGIRFGFLTICCFSRYLIIAVQL